MRRRRDEELYGAFDEQEDELSLEAILAEYGKGGRQPVLEEPSEGPPSRRSPFLNRSLFRSRNRSRKRSGSRDRNMNPPRRIGWR